MPNLKIIHSCNDIQTENSISIYNHQINKNYTINNFTRIINNISYNQNNFFDIAYNNLINFSNNHNINFFTGDISFSIDLINIPKLLPYSIATLNINTFPVFTDLIDKNEFNKKLIICEKNQYINFQPKVLIYLCNDKVLCFDKWYGSGLVRISVSEYGDIACVVFNSDKATMCINIPGLTNCTKKNIIISSIYKYELFQNELCQYNCNLLKPVFTEGSIISDHLLLSNQCFFSGINKNNHKVHIETSYL